MLRVDKRAFISHGTTHLGLHAPLCQKNKKKKAKIARTVHAAILPKKRLTNYGQCNESDPPVFCSASSASAGMILSLSAGHPLIITSLFDTLSDVSQQIAGSWVLILFRKDAAAAARGVQRKADRDSSFFSPQDKEISFLSDFQLCWKINSRPPLLDCRAGPCEFVKTLLGCAAIKHEPGP